MVIQHNANVGNWDNENILINAEVLILGSFNPFNLNGDNADFYYGRRSNYFWKIIGQELYNESTYFDNSFQRKIDIMFQKKFCFLDIVKSIEITNGQNSLDILNTFINDKIYTNFSDSVLFTSTTLYQGERIFLRRFYNNKIIRVLNEGNIKRIIHTLGNNTISQNFTTKPKEKNLNTNGLQGFINTIVETGVNFVPDSYSPSPMAVNPGGADYMSRLRSWLVENLNLS